jgi:hypothetical protein
VLKAYVPLHRSGTEKKQVGNLPVKGNLPRGVEKKIDLESVVISYLLLVSTILLVSCSKFVSFRLVLGKLTEF